LGGDSDMRALLRSSDYGGPVANLAIGAYRRRLRARIASMATAMGGLDALVFSGGVGETSSRIRMSCCDGLAFLGLSICRESKESGSGSGHSECQASPLRSS
jgi:acetate kinase